MGIFNKEKTVLILLTFHGIRSDSNDLSLYFVVII